MGFLPDRDTGAGGTSISLKVAYRRHFQTQPPPKIRKGAVSQLENDALVECGNHPDLRDILF